MEESSSGSDSSNASGESKDDSKNSSMVDDHSTFLDKSSVSIEADQDLNAEVLDDIFPGM